MLDRQLDLGDDRQLVLQQQIVVLVNGATNRVLDRQNAVGRLALLDRREDRLEALSRQEISRRLESQRRRLGVGALLPLIRDTHHHRIQKSEVRSQNKKRGTARSPRYLVLPKPWRRRKPDCGTHARRSRA